MSINVEIDPRFYILVGDRKTWNISLEKKLWGFSEKTKGFWNTANSGDYIAFYVTTPMKRIIGFGKFGKKFVGKSLIWPEEKLNDSLMWKYRIKFSIIHVVENWRKGIHVPKDLILKQGRTSISKSKFLTLVNEADLKWDTGIQKKVFSSI